MQRSLAAGIAIAILVLLPLGCGDDTSVEPRIDEPWVPAPTEPENLVTAIENIYNDTEHDAAERLEAFANLFADDFMFRYVDQNELPRSWGLADWLRAHENIFQAQEDAAIVSLTLGIEFMDPAPPEPPIEDHPDWVEIFATAIDLTLLTSPDDGLAVQGGQARFFVSEIDGRWWIHEITELPRLSLTLVGAGTWARVIEVHLQ